jgi:hypothetical protein
MSDGDCPHGHVIGNCPICDLKLDPTDEGELTMAVASDGKLVHVNFGEPVAWFAVPPDIALALASSLTEHAMAVKRGRL